MPCATCCLTFFEQDLQVEVLQLQGVATRTNGHRQIWRMLCYGMVVSPPVQQLRVVTSCKFND
jgi:hypothetical protein